MKKSPGSRSRRRVYFATTNSHKFEEARLILTEHGIEVLRLDAKGQEIQAKTIEEIAMASAEYVARRRKTPVIVEDAGLFVEALNGFPGPYSSYVNQTIGNKGILKLLGGITNRRAEFRSAVAFSGHTMKCFSGVVYGNISYEERGSGGFGYDPIFKPTEDRGRTFAEMTAEEKSRYSHRAKALGKFAEWYRKHIASPGQISVR